ncbi:hypothetical protein PanWU01x14_092480, partial [Parasponia andersonii]
MHKDQSITTTAAIPAPDANDQAFHLNAPLPPNAEEAKRRSFERNTSNPIATHQFSSADLLSRESDASGDSGSDASESDGENDDEEDKDEDEEGENDKDGGAGGVCGKGWCCSSLESRFSWLIGGKTEKSLLGRESRMSTIVDSPRWALGKFQGSICSMPFGPCGMSSTTISGQLVIPTTRKKKKKKKKNSEEEGASTSHSFDFERGHSFREDLTQEEK